MRAGFVACILAILIASSLVAGTSWAPGTSLAHHSDRSSSSFRFASLSNRTFDYIVTIVMENKNLSQIIGNPSAPFLNQLAQNYSLATHYTACDHPSLPNYMCLTGGYNYLSGQDCSPFGACTVGNRSIVDEIENAGLTWKAYMEDMPVPCYKANFGNYTFLTDPFVFYKSIGNNSTRCIDHVVPANSNGKSLPDDRLTSALNSTATASNYMWLTPNLCDNMHNCSIYKGDSYLSKLVPQILGSYVFRTQNASLFITFDEGIGHFPTDYVYSIWAGSNIRRHFTSMSQYSHYSLPATVEDVWGLRPLASKDQTATQMVEFFVHLEQPPVLISASFAYTPSFPDTGMEVTFQASANGGTAPYSFSWTFGDGGTGGGPILGYVYGKAGNYTVSIKVTDKSGYAASNSQQLQVDSDLTSNPPPAHGVPCKGCANGNSSRTLGLLVSFLIGLTLPLVVSFLASKRPAILEARSPSYCFPLKSVCLA